MQKVRILHSDYDSFKGAIGHIVPAFKRAYGWMIPVGASLPYDSTRLYRDEEELPLDLQTALFFADCEVEVIKNPFNFWNKLKSGALPVNKEIA